MLGRLWRFCKSTIKIAVVITAIILLLLVAFLAFVGAAAYYNYRMELSAWGSRGEENLFNGSTEDLPPPHSASRRYSQLWTWDYKSELKLHDLGWLDPDTGYATTNSLDVWIYASGTNPYPWVHTVAPIAMAGNACPYDPAVCDEYNAAFDRLADEFSVHGGNPNAGSSLKLLDCDASPNLCTMWDIEPLVLAHLKSMQPCRVDLDEAFLYICSVEWAYVGFPLKRMPYNRNIRIGGHLVPAFPSAYEQLRAIISYDQSYSAYPADVNRVSMDFYPVDPNAHRPAGSKAKIEPGAKGSWFNETLTHYGRIAAEQYTDLRSQLLGQQTNSKRKRYDVTSPF